MSASINPENKIQVEKIAEVSVCVCEKGWVCTFFYPKKKEIRTGGERGEIFTNE